MLKMKMMAAVMTEEAMKAVHIVAHPEDPEGAGIPWAGIPGIITECGILEIIPAGAAIPGMVK